MFGVRVGRKTIESEFKTCFIDRGSLKMGTERHEVFRRECYCGSGEIIIKHCMLDHPWVGMSHGWFEATISCENCRSKFELIERGSNYVMVNKSDIKAQSELCSELNRRCDDMMAWPEVQK